MLVFSIGKRYRGKTTAAYSLIRKLPARFIYDPRHDFMLKGSAVTPATILRSEDFDRVILGPPGESHDLTIRPENDPNTELQAVCGFLKRYAANRCRFGLVLDEARFYKQELRRVGANFDWLVRHGSANLVIVLTAHRIIDIPPDLRAIGDLWCVFQTTHQSDLDVFEEQFGDRKLIDKIRALKTREFMSWDDGQGIARWHLDPTKWNVEGLSTQSLDTNALPELPASDRLAGDLLDYTTEDL
jgi:hypothetical protein